MDATNPPTIAVLGAGGLVGEALVRGLSERGLATVPIARRLTPAQSAAWAPRAVVAPIVDLPAVDLAALFAARDVDVVVNCLGVLQDGPRGGTDEVHRDFVERLLAAIAVTARPIVLIHVSIPGAAEDDRTAFARTKRAAEAAIIGADLPHVILRPGFVVAPAAYGGSALMRALAALPLDLPAGVSERPFAATDIRDLSATVAWVAETWRAGRRDLRCAFEPMERHPGRVGDVLAAVRHRFGGPRPLLRLPAWTLALGARAGDLVARLGWAPPIRSTALAEMRRGVIGDPDPWTMATGLRPTPLAETLAALPATVQERWFARLYLTKALVIGGLVLFWLVSGLLALGPAFAPAAGILIAHGMPPAPAAALTLVTALADIAVAAAIARRSTCRLGLYAGLLLAGGYLLGAALIAPELWLDPLGAMVKVVPIMILMAVGLALLDDR